jgi:hypothetical protein
MLASFSVVQVNIAIKASLEHPNTPHHHHHHHPIFAWFGTVP